MKAGHSWGESAQSTMHQAGNTACELRLLGWAEGGQLLPRPLSLARQKLPAGPWPDDLGIT